MTRRRGRVFIIGAGPGDPGLDDRARRAPARRTPTSSSTTARRKRRCAGRGPTPSASPWARRPNAPWRRTRSRCSSPKRRATATPWRASSGATRSCSTAAPRKRCSCTSRASPFEVVPGVTSAVGAAAYAGIPLTHPDAGDAVVLIRGHEDEVDSIPERRLARARLARRHASSAGPARGSWRGILRALVDQGRPPDDAAALIYRGTQPSQRTVAGTIGELLELVTTAAPENGEAALLVVGDVVRLARSRALVRRAAALRPRIIVTRSPDRRANSRTRWRISAPKRWWRRRSGSRRPRIPKRWNAPSASLDRFDWVVFESAVAVARFLSALTRGPRDLRAFGRTSICAVGPSTEDQLRAGGLKPDVVIPELQVDSIGDAMAAHAPVDGRSVLVVRPDHERNVVSDALVAARRHGHRPDRVPHGRPIGRTRRPRSASIACCSTARWTPSRSRVRRPCAASPPHRRRTGGRSARHDGRRRHRPGDRRGRGRTRHHVDGGRRDLHGRRTGRGAGETLQTATAEGVSDHTVHERRPSTRRRWKRTAHGPGKAGCARPNTVPERLTCDHRSTARMP